LKFVAVKYAPIGGVFCDGSTRILALAGTFRTSQRDACTRESGRLNTFM